MLVSSVKGVYVYTTFTELTNTCLTDLHNTCLHKSYK